MDFRAVDVKKFLFPLLMLAAVLSAQEFRGTFSGTVTDPSGAGIPKANVIATETGTGTKTTVSTEASGAFTIPFLPPGTYDLSAEAPGFKKYLRNGVMLSAGDSPVVNITLDVGASTESVTITAGYAPP